MVKNLSVWKLICVYPNFVINIFGGLWVDWVDWDDIGHPECPICLIMAIYKMWAKYFGRLVDFGCIATAFSGGWDGVQGTLM